MPVTRSQTAAQIRSIQQSLQESNANDNTQQQQQQQQQQQRNESTAAAEEEANATIATAPVAATRSSNAERHKRKKRQSATDPGTKGPANTPKRSKLQPSVRAEAVQERLDRALTQRMYVVSRVQKNDHHIEFHVLGSTGNYYTVHITNKMKCDCYDHRYRRLHCKHLLLVLARVFHVERGSPAYAKLSLTDEELQAVFANCVPDPTVMVDDEVKALIDSKISGQPVKDDEASLIRKSLKDDPDCPICYETLTEDQIAAITFCKVCGNNVHKDCFQQWRQQLTKHGQTVTCVFCRSPWKIPKPITKPKKSSQGFANFAHDSGLLFDIEEELQQQESSTTTS